MDLQKLKTDIPYQWRVQSIKYNKAVCVAYIDSRQVQDLLDDVCGAGNWQSDYKEVKGNVYGGIGILINNQWVWKWDCGVESKTDGEKGEASDSFKRAAVKWGVGRFLYSLEIVSLNTIAKNNREYPLNEKTGKPILSKSELTEYINSLRSKDDTPPKTTLYNHKEIGNTEKPLITNLQFKKLIERIEAGDATAAENAKKAFTLEATQLRILETKLNELSTSGVS